MVVDDERKMGVLLKGELEDMGHEVVAAQDGPTAVRIVKEHSVDLVLSDIRMEPMDGLELLEKIRQTAPQTDVIMMTAYATTETAVEALRRGVVDYLMKPLDMAEVAIAIDRALDAQRLRLENRQLKLQLSDGGVDDTGVVAESPAMKRIMAMVNRVAVTDSTVLITGLSGVGKEVVAQAVHRRSTRSDGALVAVNCAALPENLLESELFGHERGAFTGADSRKLGRFELAHGGTLFLDEIGEIGPNVQVKLLRVLETRQFERVGGTTTIKTDARVVVATNSDLGAAVAEGGFREDLYYRLNVFPIEIPPICERREDVVPLAQRWLVGRRLSGDAAQALTEYDWPGNVRELRNVLERASILADGDEIAASDLLLPGAHRTPAGGVGTAESLNIADHERSLLREALKRSGGNKTAAAELLGISRRALYSRAESLDVEL